MKNKLRKVTAALILGLACMLFSNEIFATQTIVPLGADSAASGVNLTTAITNAVANDTLVLLEGTYDTGVTMAITKTLSIIASPSATIKPKLKAKNIILSNSGTSFLLKGIFYSKTPSTLVTADYAFDFAASYKLGRYFKIIDCSIYDFPRGIRGNRGTLGDPTYSVDTFLFTNNIYYKKTDNSASYAVFYLSNLYMKRFLVQNCTFKDIQGDCITLVNTITNNHVIDHCTFYNVADASKTFLKIIGTPDAAAGASLVNLVFTNNVVSKLYDATTAVPFNLVNKLAHTISNNSFSINNTTTSTNNYDPYLSGAGSTTIKDNYLFEPTFKDVSNSNFSLSDTSILLKAGSDGKQIGDPRWINKGNAFLKTVKTDGAILSNFDPFTTTVADSVPFGTTTVPVITAIACSPEVQSMLITPAGSIAGTTSILVTAKDGTQKTYTVSFPIKPAAKDATLKSLTIGGTPLDGFDPATKAYVVTLPIGTPATPVPTVVATPNDANGSANVTPCASVPGTTSILVKAQDITVTQTYTIQFKVATALNSDTTLNSIKLDGVLIDSFAPAKKSYHIVYPFDATTIPVIEVEATNSLTVLSTITQPTSLNTTVTFTATAQDGTKVTYNVYLTQLTASSDASLVSFQYGSPAVVINAVSGQTDYNVGIEYKSAIPTITAISTVTYKTSVVVTNATTIPGTTTIKVTAQDNSEKIYSVNLTYDKSTDAYLKSLKLDTTTISGFTSNTYAYNIKLSDTIYSFPVNIIGVPDTSAASVAVSHTASSLANGAVLGTATVLVTAPNTTTKKTYTITYTIGSTDTTLSSIRLNEVSLKDFSSKVIAYSYILPYGSIVVPVVTATSTDPNATVTITQATLADGTGTATISVISQNGSVKKKKYQVVFTVADKISTLKDIKINNISISGFKADSLEYAVVVPFGTDSSNLKIAVTKTSANANTKISWSKLPCTATITVKAQDTSFSTVYKVNITVTEANTEATLSIIELYGDTIADFSPTVLNYYIVLSDTTKTTPTLTATPTYSKATVTLTQPTSLNGTATILVTAEDTSYSKTYTIRFALAVGVHQSQASALTIKQSSSDVTFESGTTIDAISVTDMNGRTISSGKYNSTTVSIGTVNLSGIYIFRVVTKGKVYFQKISISH